MQYKLRRSMGHFTGVQHPAGTVVEGRPYPADPDYLEITLPDGTMLTVMPGSDVEPVVGRLSFAEEQALRGLVSDEDLGRVGEAFPYDQAGRTYLIAVYDYVDGGVGEEVFLLTRNLNGRLEVGDAHEFDWAEWHENTSMPSGLEEE